MKLDTIHSKAFVSHQYQFKSQILSYSLLWTFGNGVNIFQNGVFQDGRQRDNEKFFKNILSLVAKSIEKPRFREIGHETPRYDPTSTHVPQVAEKYRPIVRD